MFDTLTSSEHVTPYSAISSASLSSTTSKVSSKPKPVNVFSNDGSFLERFQRSKQEGEERREAEEVLAKKKQFADRFKNRGKRPSPPDSPPAVTSTDPDCNYAKKPRLGTMPQKSEYQKEASNHRSRVFKDTGTGVHPLIK